MRNLTVLSIPPTSSEYQKGLMRASYRLCGGSKLLTLGLSVGDYQPFILIGTVHLTVEDIITLLETKSGGARGLINAHLEDGLRMTDLHLFRRIIVVLSWKNKEPVIAIVSRDRPQERCHLNYGEWNTLCLLDYCITGHLNRQLRCSANANAYIKRLFNGLFEREFEKLSEDTCDPPPLYQFYSDCCIIMRRICTRILDQDEYLFLSKMCLYHLRYMCYLFKKTPINHYRS